jgi:hypothetical protein
MKAFINIRCKRFPKGNDDTPCSIYKRLAKFAKESGDAFIE